MKANGPALRAIRLSQGWTPTQLGAAVGLHRSRICHIEAGRSGASETKMRLIADALQVPIAAITLEKFPHQDLIKSKTEDAA